MTNTRKSLFRLYILLGTALLFILAGVPIHAGAPAKWQKYVLADGRYSVLLPGKPTVQVRDQPGRQSTLHIKLAQYAVPGRVYSTVYMYYTPEKSLPTPISQRYAVFKTGFLGKDKKLLKESDLKLQGHPGKEYRVAFVDKPVTAVCRCYLVGETLYQEIVSVAFRRVDSPDTEKFLNSFRFLSPARR